MVAYFLEGVTGVRIFQASGSSASLLPLLDKFSGEGGGGGVFCSRIIPLRGKLFLVRCAPLSLSLSLFRKRGMGYTVLGSVSKKGFFRGKVLKVIHESRR